MLCLQNNKTVATSECEQDSVLDSSQSCNKQACTDGEYSCFYEIHLNFLKLMYFFFCVDEVLPVEVGSTQPEDYEEDEDWCDDDEEDEEFGTATSPMVCTFILMVNFG